MGSNREVIVKATLVSFAEIRCDLTDWFKTNNIKLSYLGFAITVSNDGSRFSSNSLLYKIYDSKCMECSNGSCQAKVNWHFVDFHMSARVMFVVIWALCNAGDSCSNFEGVQ